MDKKFDLTQPYQTREGCEAGTFWKLVPVEPTEEILVELAELCVSAIQETRGPTSTLEHFGENIRSAYSAMLEAAPIFNASEVGCPDCGGFGATDMIAGDDCERCSGTGKIAADEITRLRDDMEAFSDAANEANARAEAARAEQDRLKELNAALRSGRDQSQDQATAFFNRAEAAEAEQDRLQDRVRMLERKLIGNAVVGEINRQLKEQSDD